MDVGGHRVTRSGVDVPLPKLSFELLLALVRAHPRMVTPEELLDIVWAPAVVNPETVGQRVKLLRQALNDDARAPRYIVGVRGLGYRIGVPVKRVVCDPPATVPAGQDARPVAPATGPVLTIRQLTARQRLALVAAAGAAVFAVTYLVSSGVFKDLARTALHGRGSEISASARPIEAGASLAVLPFIDMSPQHDQQYFSDGLAEEVLNKLAQLPALRVVGRTSSFAFRGQNDDVRRISQLLNVNHVLEGSVRKDRNRVRVAVQLIDSSDGSYIWSQTYERTLDDVFAIQEDIGRAVAAELKLRLDAWPATQGGTRNVAAFDEFLIGRALLNSNEVSMDHVDAAVSHLSKAVAQDPRYLDAWIWLIDSYTRKALDDAAQRGDCNAAQQQAIATVSELAPQSVYAAIAESYGALTRGTVQDAGQLLEATLAAPPGIRARVRMHYGQFLLSMGRAVAAVDELTRARAVDPLDVFVRQQLILALEVSGQLDRADAESAQLLQLPGGDAALERGDRLVRMMGRGDRVALAAALERKEERPFQSTAAQERLLASLDDPKVALRQLRSTLADARTSSDIYALTSTMEWAAFLHDPELSLQAGHDAAALRVSFETWAWSIWRPVMKDVRRQPGFKTLLLELHIPEYWRATGEWGDFCRPLAGNDFECT
jgi:TolB-like protein/DNA-binding winged helix-turn-helix (wHTH) protein